MTPAPSSRWRQRFALLTSCAAALAMTAGCATGPDANPKDPLEPLNRGVMRVNDEVDKYVLKPVAQAYDFALPSPVQIAVSNFFSNISDVYSAANNLMQGKPTRAVEDSMRVIFNSTLGIGGLIDIATPAGLPKYKEDFGQTLGVWGVPPGPYLVLPVFGPSSVRDTAGMLVDRVMDPSAYVYPVWVRNSFTGVRLVSTRAQLLGVSNLLEQAALDRYSFLRDAYLQRREYQIYDGNPPRHEEDREQPDGQGAPAPAGGAQPESQTLPVTPSVPSLPGLRLGR